MKWIITGLGNPGEEYATTRHNAGRIVVDHLRASWGFPDWKYMKSYDALVTKGEVYGKEVLLVLPETYMNDSGKSLKKIVKSADQAAQLVVIHDDADLTIGGWRFAFGRGAGGQKGVSSIITTLMTKAFTRVRIGIAPPLEEGKSHKKAGEYVLGKFRSHELATLKESEVSIERGIERLLSDGLELARSQWQRNTPRTE